MNTYLGIELGSTRIKAISIDEKYKPISSGNYTWQSDFNEGIWTYDLSEVWNGIKAALQGIEKRVFKDVTMETLYPENNMVKRFERYFADYKRILHIEKTAIDVLGE